MALLGARLILHGVDAEKIVRRALDDTLHRWGARLPPSDYDDALTDLIAMVWELSLSYDSERGPSFSTHAYRRVQLRTVDWYRTRYGSTRYRKRPEILSLDAPPSIFHTGRLDLAGDDDDGDQPPIRGTGLGEPEPAWQMDPAESRSPSLTRALEQRGCERPDAA